MLKQLSAHLQIVRFAYIMSYYRFYVVILAIIWSRFMTVNAGNLLQSKYTHKIQMYSSLDVWNFVEYHLGYRLHVY